MAEKLVMPALSPTMEKGVIAKWLKKEGDRIASGEVLCEVETDKAVMEYPSGTDGVLLKILVSEGGAAAVEEPIGIVGQPGEDITSLLDTMAQPPATESPGEKASPAPRVEGEPREDKIRSSPLARKLAGEAGLDLREIPGTGPEGRVTKEDVERAIGQGAGKEFSKGSPGDQVLPVSARRKVIADRLARSKFTAPHYYLTISTIVDGLFETRKKYNAENNTAISLNAHLIKLAAEAIKHHPVINSTWRGETILQHGRIDIALAVAQSDGLAAPVVRDCGNKGIAAIDAELKGLIEKAKTNRLTPGEYEGATFTISNLGSFGIEEFTAIINPPGSAILAVGAASRQPVVSGNDDLVIRTVMRMTLSCDHRVIDGAVGAEYLKTFKGVLESPTLALY
jgi:pyruvate dehydrogenase E2 component (dihydrolipoamide acetyltransferase)